MTALTFVSMFKHFYVMFYKPSATPNYKRVARNFHRGENNNQVSTFKYLMPLVFEASSIQCAFVRRFYAGELCSDFSQKINSISNLIDKYKSWYLVKFQALFWMKATICL